MLDTFRIRSNSLRSNNALREKHKIVLSSSTVDNIEIHAGSRTVITFTDGTTKEYGPVIIDFV